MSGDPTEGRGPGTVTVAVVDDNPVIRTGLRALLEASGGITVVGEAGDGDAAVSLVREARPDVTLLDVRMPRRDGVQVLGEVRGLTHVVMLTYADAPNIVHAALAGGACGYLVHGHFAADELERAVLTAAGGALVLGGPAVEVLRDGLRPSSAPAPRHDHSLSSREAEVMDLIAEGMTNRQISAALFLSEKTVKNHVNHIFAKLSVSSRAAAVALWLGREAQA